MKIKKQMKIDFYVRFLCRKTEKNSALERFKNSDYNKQGT